jgi:pimeloyl-ACP methyl ester carboxylesterase
MKPGYSKWLTSLYLVAISSISFPALPQNTPVKNVVLVHGAFVDGSGWEDVYTELARRGYNVSISQHTLQSLQTDVMAVTRIIDQQDGPCILVGHSYGGVVISAAGNHPKVAGLVYVAAHAPDAHEKRADLFSKYPPAYKSLIKGEDGYDFIDPEKFPEDFAGGVPLQKAKFMAAAQPPTADACFTATIDLAAWKEKPVWYVVASADRIINPDLERFYAKRANAQKTVEVKGASHCVFMTHPQVVTEMIVDASKGNR